MEEPNDKPIDPGDISAYKLDEYDEEENTSSGKDYIPLISILRLAYMLCP